MTPATTISILRQYKNNGDTIEAFEATMIEVYLRRTGTGAYGDYSFQDAKLKDNAGDIIDCSFTGIDDIKESKGKCFRFASNKNAKGELKGITVKDSEYNGVTTRKLQMSKTTSWADMHDSRPASDLRGAVDGRLQQDAPASHAPASQPAPSQPRAPSDAPAPNFLLGVKKRALRLAGMHGICYDAAVHSALEILKRHGYAMVPTAVGILADKIFMECVRRTDIDLMPLDPWEAGFKGQPLTILIDELNRQVLDHADAKSQAMSERTQKNQAPAPAAPPPPVDDDAPADDSMPF